MKRRLSIAATAATVVAGVAMAMSGTPAAANPPQVTVGGKPLNVSCPVECSTTNGKFSIAIGEAITGVIVGLEPDASAVHDVGLGTINGVVLSFTEGAPGNTASATKTGNSYHITGTATGMDNGGQQVSKPFTIDATCP